MAVLTDNKILETLLPVPLPRVRHAAGVDVLYDGAFAMESSGYAVALTAGGTFIGVVSGKVDNSAGSAGDKNVFVLPECVLRHAVTGASVTTLAGASVYASDDNVLTLTAGANSLVGEVLSHITGTECSVKLSVQADAVPLDRAVVFNGVVPVISTAGAVTVTIAQLITGLVQRDCTGAARTDTLPTAALIIAGIDGLRVGDSFEFVYQNTSDAAETITIAAGSGGTADAAATLTIAQNNSKRFRITMTNVTASSEAYTLYSFGTVVH